MFKNTITIPITYPPLGINTVKNVKTLKPSTNYYSVKLILGCPIAKLRRMNQAHVCEPSSTGISLVCPYLECHQGHTPGISQHSQQVSEYS